MAVLSIEDCATMRSPGRLVRRIDKIMAGVIETRFGEYDISYPQWIALKVVRDGQVSTAGELASELGITTGAITRLIDALESRGLMLRDRNAADRRVVRLSITPAGREIVLKLQQRVIAGWNEVLVDFSQEEAGVMVDMLRRLLDAAEQVAGQKGSDA